MFGLIFGGLSTLATAAITAYNKSKDVTIAGIQASARVASSQMGYMTAALDHPFSPVSIICYTVAIWFFKAQAIDKVFCPALGMACSTDPLGGQLADITKIAVGGMFALYGLRQFKS